MKVLAIDIGIITLSICILSDDGQLHEWKMINVHEQQGIPPKTKTTIHRDCELVIDCLKTQNLLQFQPDRIIIEQQPAGGSNRFSSVRMKCVSHAIHAFFYTLQNSTPVEFIHPSLKLFDVPKQTSASTGARYRNNKKSAITKTREVIETELHPECRPMAHSVFDTASKQDDLSDCLLLARAFLIKHPSV